MDFAQSPVSMVFQPAGSFQYVAGSAVVGHRLRVAKFKQGTSSRNAIAITERGMIEPFTVVRRLVISSWFSQGDLFLRNVDSVPMSRYIVTQCYWSHKTQHKACPEPPIEAAITHFLQQPQLLTKLPGLNLLALKRRKTSLAVFKGCAYSIQIRGASAGESGLSCARKKQRTQHPRCARRRKSKHITHAGFRLLRWRIGNVQ